MIDPAILASVVTALITGAFTLMGVLAANNAQRKVSEAKQDARMDALETKMDTYHREEQETIEALKKENAERIDELKVEQAKHNKLMERTFLLEKDVGILKSK